MIETLLPKFKIRGRELLPVVQGGMGVGISAHRLAGTVAREGAVGTIASVELRNLHPDLMERTGKCKDNHAITEANLEALDREICAARALAGAQGFIAVNVMKAVSSHAALVDQACRSGADAIVMGAGLPLDLPEMVGGHDVALIPILSEERGVRAVLKKWMRKGRLPDALVIEHPKFAGGHLGAPRAEDINDNRFGFETVMTGIGRVFEELGLIKEQIPVILAGGINSFQKIKQALEWGAQGVQLGTPFAVTQEGDAHDNFKYVLLNATPANIVTFMSSAGLPARAVLTPWLSKYLERETKLRERADPNIARCPRKVECLSHCGFKDGDGRAGQFCIETQLAAAQRGDIRRGLFFRGAEALPFGDQMRSVRELLSYLLTGALPVGGSAFSL